MTSGFSSYKMLIHYFSFKLQYLPDIISFVLQILVS
nr:MAG TPA: hypothetical protein [Caudoviricetes sp.]